jgi:hypothetical protein
MPKPLPRPALTVGFLWEQVSSDIVKMQKVNVTVYAHPKSPWRRASLPPGLGHEAAGNQQDAHLNLDS